jgi:hypothetical protein
VVSPDYQGKHAAEGGGEAGGGGMVATFTPPLVSLGFLRWADGALAQRGADSRRALALIGALAQRLTAARAPENTNPQ